MKTNANYDHLAVTSGVKSLPPAERYLRDAEFYKNVNLIYGLLAYGLNTVDLIESVDFAITKYKAYHLESLPIIDDKPVT